MDNKDQFDFELRLTALLEQKLATPDEFIKTCFTLEESNYSHELIVALMSLLMNYDDFLDKVNSYDEETDSSTWS